MRSACLSTYYWDIVLTGKIIQGLGEKNITSVFCQWAGCRGDGVVLLDIWLEIGYGAPASPCCLLTISSVCLNHAVLLGLKTIFVLVSVSAREKGRQGNMKGSSQSSWRAKLYSAFFSDKCPHHFFFFISFYPFPPSSLVLALLFFLYMFRVWKKSLNQQWVGKEENPLSPRPSLLVPHSFPELSFTCRAGYNSAGNLHSYIPQTLSSCCIKVVLWMISTDPILPFWNLRLMVQADRW